MLSISDGMLVIGWPVRIVRQLVSLACAGRYRVIGSSMLPTLTDSQLVLGSSWNKLRRGNVVVLRHPILVKSLVIKRIVGLPMEEVRLENGNVYINGSILEEPYLNGSLGYRTEYDREWWLGPDEYFVMGDNRDDSQDSRRFGQVDRHNILGWVWFRCWPPRAWGLLSSKVHRLR
jgi:signal peptidase I